MEMLSSVDFMTGAAAVGLASKTLGSIAGGLINSIYNHDFQRGQATNRLNSQLEIEESKRKFWAEIEKGREDFQLWVNSENMKIAYETNEQNHLFRIKEIREKSNLIMREKEYQQVIASWPLHTPPIVMRDQQLLPNNTVALRVLFSKNNDQNFCFYSEVERHLDDFISSYKNCFNSKNIVFFHRAWKDNCAGGAFVDNIRFLMKDLPVLVVDVDMLPGGDIRLSVTAWGFNYGNNTNDSYVHGKAFNISYDPSRLSDKSYSRELSDSIAAHLKFSVGYIYDLYNLAVYNRIPLLPRVAQYDLDNIERPQLALLNYDDIRATFSNEYSNMYFRLLGKSEAQRLGDDLESLPGSRIMLMSDLRFRYATATKGLIPSEEYTQYLDESVQAWSALRTTSDTRSFLRSMLNNPKNSIDKYYSKDDRRHWIRLCSAYKDAEKLDDIGKMCMQLGVYMDGAAASDWYRQAAESGDMEAQFRLGQCFSSVKKYSEAIKWYSLSAAQGYNEAKCKLADYLYNGLGCNKDYCKAVLLYKEAAKSGYSWGQYGLGNCFSYGKGVEKNLATALEWYKKAAQQLHLEAQFRYAECLLEIQNANSLEPDKNTIYSEYFAKTDTLCTYALWRSCIRVKECRSLDDLDCFFTKVKCGINTYSSANKIVHLNYDESIEYYRLAAERGHAESQYKLGQCFYFGYGVDKDFSEAIDWYRKAAEQGHIEAQYKLGRCYYCGYGVDKDYSEAVKFYKKAAERGHAGAQSSLGLCFFRGHGVIKNDKHAYTWCSKAAQQGYVKAQADLGNYFFKGYGVAKNYTEAVNWYRLAAEQGNAEAQYGLGRCFDAGYGVERDYIEAFRYYSLAAEQGHASAQSCLGDCYKYGYGTAQNYHEAVKWYERSAQQSNKYGQYNLADSYRLGLGVDTKDCYKAFQLYLASAEQGYSYAQVCVGNCYLLGEGTEIDYDKAVEWYSVAAKKDNAEAQWRLGDCYFYGCLVDYEEAIRWYFKSARNGNAEGQFKLANCYENGFGIEIDCIEAEKWYRKASEQGHEFAQFKLKQFLED